MYISGRADGKVPRGGAALAEAAGVPQEVCEARLLEGELEATGPRLSGKVAVLKKQLSALRETPPVGAPDHPLWSEYVRYGEERLAELERGTPVKKGRQVEPPLQWEGYLQMRGGVTRGLAFERTMAEVLRSDAALPKAQRRFLGDFDQPRVETFVGVWKPESELRFADVLVIEQQPPVGQSPRVETFSFKSRDLSKLDGKSVTAQMKTDASAALRYYGETLDIRRASLHPLLWTGSEVSVSRICLIYEGGVLEPKKPKIQTDALKDVGFAFPQVEVLFQ